jgi:hypothetical protein
MLVGLMTVLAWFALEAPSVISPARFAGRVPTSSVTSGAIAGKNEREEVSGLACAPGHAGGMTARPRAGTANSDLRRTHRPLRQ